MAEKREIWRPHPVFEVPSLADIEAYAVMKGLPSERAALELEKARHEQIAKSEEDPLRCGWEPPIWWVCDCLLGFPWVDEEEAEQLRRVLGFEHPVSVLLINGGNRGGKSEYAAKRTMEVLQKKEDTTGWAMDQGGQRSRENQQKLYWKYLIPEWQKLNGIKEEIAYYKWSKKRGFTDSRAVWPNGSDMNFYTYNQDGGLPEGGMPDMINPDEMVESDLVETMRARIAERMGKMIITFTPVNGYVDTVKMFQDGARTVKTSTAFLCPKDGGEPDVRRFLGGVSGEHLRKLEDFVRNPKKHGNPSMWSIPEDCRRWLDGESGQPAVPEGREFVEVPRVMKCLDENSAVVFFHSGDNPYGNPVSLWHEYKGSSQATVLMRMYGVAEKLQSVYFPRFNENVHVVEPGDIPREGTDYLIVDPCSGRNFFMAWFRATPEAVFVVKEWPNQVDPVPGEGVLGPWAYPSGKKLDGKPGPAQESLGWGLADYKLEIARIEGWKPYRDWAEGKLDRPEYRSMGEWVAEWPEYCEKEMDVRERFMDARFMNVKSFHRDGMETLQDEFEDIGLTFYATSSDAKESIRHGGHMVNDALSYNTEQPLSSLNHPRLYVSSECKNIIFALSTWTGKDGQKGATKDPVDVVRYYFLKKLGYVNPEMTGFVRGGGCY